ncbi:sugar transferase [Nocardioides kribbensis]|uniref:sugar transferase n=1 Tax=Nocardioides kribbensis TaxID=305517 RepID=UPI0032DB858A
MSSIELEHAGPEPGSPRAELARVDRAADGGLVDVGLVDAGLVDVGLVDVGLVDVGLVDLGLADLVPEGLPELVADLGADLAADLAAGERWLGSQATRACRAACDLAGRAAALMLLVGVLSLLLGLVVAVRLDSAGPALFRQVRVGRGERPFIMLKLRSMEVAAELRLEAVAHLDEGNGVLFKMRRDPRVTRVGAVLRRWSLDELPQLWNVVRGDMALVGPRPALPSEVEAYDERTRRRLRVKPGLTGLWQVSGRSDLSWDDSVRLDLTYVDQWSLRLEASILLRTLGAVVGRRGAY